MYLDIQIPKMQVEVVQKLGVFKSLCIHYLEDQLLSMIQGDVKQE